MWLFSYGSNHPEQLAERLGRDVETYPAFLPKHVRVFRGHSRTWNSAVASIEKGQGVVYGLAIEVDEYDLELLDRFEGVHNGNYERYTAMGNVDGDKKKLVMYRSLSEKPGKPSRKYLEACARTIGAHWTGAGGRVPKWSDITIR